MDATQPIQEPETTEEAEQRGHRRLLYLLSFWCAGLIDVVLLDVALGFRRSSAAYQWMNRMGIFLGLTLTFGFLFWAQWLSTRSRWKASSTSTWIFRAVGIIVPTVFVLKTWSRIPEAFWLR